MAGFDVGQWTPWLYLAAAILFIVGLKQLGQVKTARRGNAIAAVGMFLAVLGSLVGLEQVDWRWITGGDAIGAAIGVVLALRTAMTAMPELVAGLNGIGGAASACIASAVAWRGAVEQTLGAETSLIEAIGGVGAASSAASIFVGVFTLTGSIIALTKLQGWLKGGAPILLPARHLINAALLLGTLGLAVWWGGLAQGSEALSWGIIGIAAVAGVLGVLLVIPIGGADMPVVVSLLNAYSGLAAAAAGFALNNSVLIIAGSMVGAAGLILTQIMCVAMNRSLTNVVLGGFGQGDGASSDPAAREYETVTSCGPEEAAMIMDAASSVIIIPGYGLAVAQAQHAVREFAQEMEARGAKVRYAIHPVAGRMPGHMNVLLAEADVPYDRLVEMDAINSEFRTTDVALVLGANDVVNPSATEDRDSPLWGMPILRAHEARSVFVVKRSLSPGYAGVKNPLFERDNAMMVFGDAKDVLQGLTAELETL